MARRRPPLLRLAERWIPNPDDPFGRDKKAPIDFLLERDVTSTNPMSIERVLTGSGLGNRYRRNAFQHKLLGPLRRDPRVFVGTSNAGIYLVTTPEDVDQTLGFYTWRVRAELRHARNLRAIAKRFNLFRGHESAIAENRERAVIYVDESGTPDVEDQDQRVFVVGAVVIETRKEVASLEQRFRNASAILKRPVEHELRTSGLSVAKHARALHELSLIDYQWAAACFVKPRLTSAGFQEPRTLYRYAFQFLIGDLLMTAWQADLVIDEHSTPEFQRQLEAYLRKQNSGLPVQRLQRVSFAESSKQRLIQLADLVAGAVRRSTTGAHAPLDEIEHQMINLQFWPPR